MKTVTMVTGEFDFDDIFHFGVPTSEFTPIPFSTINYIVWIIFLILVPIILSNMLVSGKIAVHMKAPNRRHLRPAVIIILVLYRKVVLLQR